MLGKLQKIIKNSESKNVENDEKMAISGTLEDEKFNDFKNTQFTQNSYFSTENFNSQHF